MSKTDEVTDSAKPRLWTGMSFPEIQAEIDRGSVVVVPLGAIEQHGPHLPVDVDAMLPYEVAKEASRHERSIVVAPTIWWGLSGAHRKFAGVITLSIDTYLSVLRDVCDSIVNQGFRRIVLFNGHGGNGPAARIFVHEFMERTGVSIVALSYADFVVKTYAESRRSPISAEFHAGEFETAMMMHARPDGVHMDRVDQPDLPPGQHFGLEAAQVDVMGGGSAAMGFDLRAKFPDGVAGDPTVASPELGRQMFDESVRAFCAFVAEYAAWTGDGAEPTAHGDLR